MDPHPAKSKNFYQISILFTSLRLLTIPATLSHPSLASAAEVQNISASSSSSCGSIPLQHPFGSNGAFPYKHMLQCDQDAKKLHLSTVSGPFEIQGLDYHTQTMVISDPSMSTCSSLHPITNHHFSVDSLLPPTSNNTLLLFNCPHSISGLCKKNSSAYCEHMYRNCDAFGGLRSRVQGSEAAVSSSSSVGCCATDFHRLGNQSLGELQCEYYTSVYGGGLGAEWGYGIRLSFCMPNRIPDVRLCDECDRPDGNCGIGLRCICHPQQCGNIVMSRARVQSLPQRTILGGLLFLSMLTGFGLWNV